MASFQHELPEISREGWALDIDDTICATVTHWIELLSERFGNPEGLMAHEIAAKHGYYAPYWQTEEALAWMEGLRRSNELNEKYLPLASAQTMVSKLHEHTPIVAYITARPESSIESTRTWLTAHVFPDAPVIAMPNELPVTVAGEWKASILETLYPRVRGIVDDNPKLADKLSPDYQGKVYVIGSSDHPRKSAGVIPCQTWDEVLKSMGVV